MIDAVVPEPEEELSGLGGVKIVVPAVVASRVKVSVWTVPLEFVSVRVCVPGVVNSTTVP